MSKRERLEITFGEKDMDIWEYLEASGLPKASLAKKMLRDVIKNEGFQSVSVNSAERKELPKEEQKTKIEMPKVTEKILDAETGEISEREIVERVEQKESPKKINPFGNLAAKK